MSESVKLVECYEYGSLKKLHNPEEESWLFQAYNREYEFINSTLIETLDELSMEGWDLVCPGELGYILRKPVLKEEPKPIED
ncbi:hypothetical protein PA598K_06873 [Paenibacillus sp. 598K]|uniref:hypothetical protein n=1 Tax=Paenibacillus sp. 598K TaxID=1117987 RepID=UPI000FF94337|nr:hypothetical protein [Paenibacillus sp. 598K]GBF78255.1 hypothetical protein PA598K_06873 [Paenibacillus sp. 598K]